MNIRASIRDTLSFGLLKDQEPDHLRIKDVPVRALVDMPEIAPSPDISVRDRNLQSKYNASIAKIDRNIYAMASAVTSLDNIEAKLLEVKGHLEDLMQSGQPVDYDKVEDAIHYLAEQVNLTIQDLDDQCINLLRDSRIHISFAEIDGPESATIGVDLTLISLDKIMSYKVRQNGANLSNWIDFTENFASIVHSNVHIISSMMLTLFASRDYTNEVTKFAFPQAELSHGDSPSMPVVSNANNQFSLDQQTAPTDDLAGLEFEPGGYDDRVASSHQSLMDLLHDIREHAAL